jgi:KTSC domain
MPSRAIEWTHWQDEILSVSYRGGDAYDYFDVPRRVYRQLLATPSKGQFVNWAIKPKYRYLRRRTIA